MKTILVIIAGLAILAYSNGLKITFNPFSIKLTEPLSFFGYLFVIVGFSLIMTSSQQKSYQKGYKACFDKSMELIDSIKNNPEKP